MSILIADLTPRRKARGFTMVELMMTLVVLAILAVAGTPFYTSFITNQRLKTASFDTMALLTFTRSEAIKRNGQVTLNSNGGAINIGTLFAVTPAGGTAVRQQSMFKGINMDCVDTSKNPHAYVACPANTGVVYGGNGRLAAQFGTLASPVFELHEPNASTDPVASYRCITVDMMGRPMASKGKC